MKTRYLFPHSFKKVGWILLIPSIICGLIMTFEIFPLPQLNISVYNLIGDGGFLNEKAFTWIENNVMDELICILIISGALLAACSREKIEDEYISRIRLESLLWATYINFGLLLLAVLFVYGSGFLTIMSFNLVTPLIIFLFRFNFVLFMNGKATRYEE